MLGIRTSWRVAGTPLLDDDELKLYHELRSSQTRGSSGECVADGLTLGQSKKRQYGKGTRVRRRKTGK